MILGGSWIYVGCREIAGGGMSVRRISNDGTTEQVLAVGLEEINGIALGHGNVYFTVDGVQGRGGAILTVPTAGGATTELIGGLDRPYGPLVVGDWLYFTEIAGQEADGRISRVPRLTAPTGLEVLARGRGVPFFLAASDTHVYWSAYRVGLQRVPLAGGTTETLASCAGDQMPSSYGCARFVLDRDSITFSGRDRSGGGAIFSVNTEEVP